jgi:hypoxanthine phosphoribosyltransferase
MANEINAYYSQILKEEGHLDLLIVCVLKGAFMFFSDLIKKIEHLHTIDFIKCRSY